jgi:hypothetical protein
MKEGSMKSVMTAFAILAAPVAAWAADATQNGVPPGYTYPGPSYQSDQDYRYVPSYDSSVTQNDQMAAVPQQPPTTPQTRSDRARGAFRYEYPTGPFDPGQVQQNSGG